MTSYKKLAEDFEEKLIVAISENELLKQQLSAARLDLAAEAVGYMPTEDARAALNVFADRARNREELVLLIRALSNLK